MLRDGTKNALVHPELVEGLSTNGRNFCHVQENNCNSDQFEKTVKGEPEGSLLTAQRVIAMSVTYSPQLEVLLEVISPRSVITCIQARQYNSPCAYCGLHATAVPPVQATGFAAGPVAYPVKLVMG